MISIDKYAYNSKLKNVAPAEKLFFSIITLGVCLWENSIIISVLVLLIMGWVTICKGGIPASLFLKLILVPMSFLIIGVFTIAVNIKDNNNMFLYSFFAFGKYIGVSANGLYVAVRLFFKALGAVACLYFISLSTPIVDLLGVLRRLKVPKLLIELMSLIYRYIFVLLETAETMYTAQKSRMGYINLSTSFRSMASLASNLFIRSYKRSDDLYTALESRGYEGELNVLDEKFDIRWKGYIITVAINLFLILLNQLSGGLL